MVFLLNLLQNPNTPEDFNIDLDKKKYILKKILSTLRTTVILGIQIVYDTVRDKKSFKVYLKNLHFSLCFLYKI